MLSKLKSKIIIFGANHKKKIMKYTPAFILNIVEKLFFAKTADFKRVTEFDSTLTAGVNFIGYLKAESGLGQASRLALEALLRTGHQISAIDTNNGLDDAYGDTQFDDILSTEFKHKINIFHVQPGASFEIMLSLLGREGLRGRYNIGYWLFELEDIPEKWQDTFKYINEIWTPAKFTTEAYSKVSPVPVFTMPYGVEGSVNPKLSRKDFGIPEGKFCYLVMFNSRSGFERKNPVDAIKAFVSAFPDNDDVCLVIKASHLSSEDNDFLTSLLKNVHHYRIINEIISKADNYSLISLCDVFVSLHRSEGFGLVMAEAMLLGTVCIATSYSANTDFMDSSNSCPVDYELKNIELKDDIVYAQDKKWAYPDVKQASEYMVKLYEDREFYNTLKTNAQENIKRELSIEKSTERMNERISEILGRY